MRAALPWLSVTALSALAPVSPVANAQVPVDCSELDGAIVGRVCRDDDGDGRCGPKDSGVAGARVVLENGQIAVADADGRFHFALVPARVADTEGGGRIQPGRHRVTLDTRGLAPGEKALIPARTVEVPMAGAVLIDFPIRSAPRATAEVQLAPQLQAPAGVLEGKGGKVRFLIAGRATPGDKVTVQGTAATVDAAGVYRAWISLMPGRNDVAIAAEAPSGRVRFFTQLVDVVQRNGGVLVIPRALQPTAAVQLPGGDEQQAATGRSSLHVESAPGTKIHHPGGDLIVGESGAADIPVELRAGKNEVAVRIERPGQPARDQRLEISAAPRPLLSSLIDVEATYSPQLGRFRLFGRGGVHGEFRFGAWELGGELELRDTDFTPVNAANPVVVLLPRNPERLERVIDPERAPIAWGDDAAELSSNPASGRVRVELRHDALGRVGVGTYRAQFQDSDAGRFHSMIVGPFADLKLALGTSNSVGVSAFFSPGAVDPARPLATLPGHDELPATGGSLFYLSHPAISEGTEHVVVEVRDGRTGLPLAERHLVRGRDYEIDHLAGRILLARPLSLFEGEAILRTSPLTASPEPVLVVDYERVVLGPAPARIAGGELTAKFGPVDVSAGAVDAAGAASFQLYRATARSTVGAFGVSAEAAVSRGQWIAQDGFGISRDGGLSFQHPVSQAAGGLAFGARVRGPGLAPDGVIDAAVRWRTAGFNDSAHVDLVDHRQLSVRARQPVGPVTVGADVDFQQGADPRFPLEAIGFGSRRIGASVGAKLAGFEVGVEAQDVELTAVPDVLSATPETGGHLAAGAYARYRLFDWIGLEAGHRQAFGARGTGPGAFDDTFTHAGADLKLGKLATIGARVGWGPRLGPQAWLSGEHQSGNDTYYGSYSADVDGPDYGQGRAVSGARTEIGQGASVFVEDVAAHDSQQLLLSRAVGFNQTVAAGLSISARYERGARHPLGDDGSLSRDAAGASASWVLPRMRLYARGEGRRESGAAGIPGERIQLLASGAAELVLTDALRFSGRVNWSDTHTGAVLEAHLLEGTAALVWRTDPAMALLRYSVRRELTPALAKFGSERTFHTVSLLPALHLSDQWTVAAGAHLGWNSESGNQSLVLSGSLRPSVRVVGGLEVAAEVAARSATPDGGQWTALRGEAGYRFDERMMLAVGYTFFGFSGLGLGDGADGRADRLYLRAELAY